MQDVFRKVFQTYMCQLQGKDRFVVALFIASRTFYAHVFTTQITILNFTAASTAPKRCQPILSRDNSFQSLRCQRLPFTSNRHILNLILTQRAKHNSVLGHTYSQLCQQMCYQGIIAPMKRLYRRI